MDDKTSTPEKVETYSISIKGGDIERTINLSSRMFRFGAASVIICGVLLIVTAAFSFYSALRMHNDAVTMQDVEHAAQLRQEQLLTISKKAETLSETLQNLAQQEQELRIQAGLNPPKEDKPADAQPAPPADNQAQPAPTNNQPAEQPAQPAEVNPADNNHNGQGGPVKELDIADVSEALNMLEARVTVRKDSLNDFQNELKQRREQMARGAAMANGYTPGGGWAGSADVQFNFANGLPVIPAAGSIPAPGSFPFDPSLVGGSGSADSHIPSIWPTTGEVTSPYGLRWGGTDFHPGIDIANDMGTPIVATADGVVEYAGWNSGGYGNMVDINHGNGLMTRYGHASQVVVSAGQHVKRGQLIAYMGSTGFSTGPHVHYEVHVNGNRVNPISYL